MLLKNNSTIPRILIGTAFDKEYRNDVMRPEAENGQQEVLRCSIGENKGRSVVKTNKLHPNYIKNIKKSFGDKFIFHYNDNYQLFLKGKNIKIIDVHKNTFNIDVMERSIDGKGTDTIHLCKAPQSSMNKNKANSVNSLSGEIDRCLPNLPLMNLVFMNICPMQCYKKSKIDKVDYYTIEDVKNVNFIERLNERDRIQSESKFKYRDHVFEINIKYGYDKDLPTNFKEYQEKILSREIRVKIQSMAPFAHNLARFAAKNTHIDAFKEMYEVVNNWDWKNHLNDDSFTDCNCNSFIKSEYNSLNNDDIFVFNN